MVHSVSEQLFNRRKFLQTAAFLRPMHLLFTCLEGV